MTKANPLPSQAELDALLSYEPLTGVLRWKKAPGKCSHLLGTEAGAVSGTGYRIVGVNNVTYRAQRLIWMLAYGVDPSDNRVDHIDNDRANNRLDNLRLATNAQNNANCTGKSRSGLPKGVRKNKCRFGARVRVNKVEHWLGTFDTPELAHEAYCAAAQQHFGEFWRAA